MSHEMCASTRAESKRLGRFVLLLAVVASHMLLRPRLVRAAFVAVPSYASKALTKCSAVAANEQDSAEVRGQLGTFLVNSPAAKQKWEAFCKGRGLEPLASLDKQPAEAMEAFLADPAQYKQKELLEFLGLDTVNRPLTGLHKIQEDDPIAKAALVRELTLQQLRALIAESPEIHKLWNRFWAEKLEAIAGEGGDDARAAMAMKASFARKKVPEPGTWEALVMKEQYMDGRSNIPGFDIDEGKNALR